MAGERPEPRAVHLVGSLPDAVSTLGYRAGLDWQDAQLGGAARTGWPLEAGGQWTLPYLASLQHRPAFRVAVPGDTGEATTYRTLQVHAPRRRLDAADAALNRSAEQADMLAAAEAFAAEAGHTPQHPFRLQLSLPHPVDLALFALAGFPDWRHPARTARGAVAAVRHLDAFVTAVCADAAHACHLPRPGSPVRIQLQLETPTALASLEWGPGSLAGWHAQVTARLLTALPGGPGRHVLHLCYGDLGGTPVVRPRGTQNMVRYLNTLARALRVHLQPLPPVHLPFALGAAPPPQDVGFYAPLRELDPAWRVYGGVAAPWAEREARAALEQVEAALQRPVEAVATACGLGRLTEPEGRAALAVCRGLAADVPAAATAA